MVIDHINGDRQDNRLENLRCVTGTINNRNRSNDRRNTSGHTGVYLQTVNGCTYWHAHWRDNTGRKRSKVFSVARLGNEQALAEAIAYRAARVSELGGYTERHGT